MRTLRREILSATFTLAIPAALVLVFPLAEVIRFQPRLDSDACRASAAFVTLPYEMEVAAVRTAKTVWKLDSVGDRHLRELMSFAELPQEPIKPLLSPEEIQPVVQESVPVRYVPSAWAPSLRAPSPVKFAAEPDPPPSPVFSREELLKLE